MAHWCYCYLSLTHVIRCVCFKIHTLMALFSKWNNSQKNVFWSGLYTLHNHMQQKFRLGSWWVYWWLKSLKNILNRTCKVGFQSFACEFRSSWNIFYPKIYIQVYSLLPIYTNERITTQDLVNRLQTNGNLKKLTKSLWKKEANVTNVMKIKIM